MDINTKSVLEEGLLVKVRNIPAIIKKVYPYEKNNKFYNLLKLEPLDFPFQEFDVLWEVEIDKQIIDISDFPKPEKWDSFEKFKSFLLGLKWDSISPLKRDEIISPFKSAIKFEEYQLEPVLKALEMNRVNMLLADDVGLGKTIEAGLIMQEIISKFSANKILIICPASLQYQWKEEMKSKFNLEFEIIDRYSINRLKREYGTHVNPWNSYPRIITSMDFIKKPDILNLFKQSAETTKNWDLLIVDEVHNCAPSGKKAYVKDSDRTKMLRQISPIFEHRLFLTATPHNGYTESFTALLEMLDPYRFVRGKNINPVYLHQIMIRRLKDDILNPDGSRKFPKRIISSIDIELSENEKELFDLLNKYIENVEKLVPKNTTSYNAVRFVLTLLKKRLLSSPLAFFNSIKVHLDNLTKPENKDLKLVHALSQKISEDLDNDIERKILEEELVSEGSRFFDYLTEEENKILDGIYNNAEEIYGNPKKDSKLQNLISWINNSLFENEKWKNERLIIFTEYKDTLDYLYENLSKIYGEERIRMLYGGMGLLERESIKAIFQESPKDNLVRILIATDAASEGLNLQNHCRTVIHYEIPWNPNKLEQRNGRIDRHGQKSKEVFIYHFKFKNNEDSEFLDIVVRKINQMRTDIGNISPILEKNIESALLKEKKPESAIANSEIEKRIEKVHQDLGEKPSKEQEKLLEKAKRIRRIYEDIKKELEITPENLKLVLKTALELEGVSLETTILNQKEYLVIKNIPHSWKHLENYIKEDGKNLLLTFSVEEFTENKNIVLLHLNHPLIQQAISSFRKRLWESDDKLKRVSYKIVKDLDSPYLIAFVRLIAANPTGAKIEEKIIPLTYRIEDAKLIASNIDWKIDGYYREIPKSIGDYFRRYFPVHKRILSEEIERIKEIEKENLLATLSEFKEEEKKKTRALIRERIREIQKKLESWDKEFGSQLSLFSEEELEQVDEDKRLLTYKLEYLRKKEKEEIKKIEQKYTLEKLQIFPLGMLYLISESMLGEQ